VTKKYIIHHDKPTLLEHLLGKNREIFTAIKDINLEIKKGEKVALIGKNGSGKTTILKIITGITNPTYGRVHTKGKVVSLLDPNAGFHFDFTGIQNIYLSGVLLGMKKSEITAKLSDIIRFADIGKFIDVPIYTYSKGMIMRLGFAIAVFSNPDILVLDESIVVGDEAFQKKSVKKIEEFFLKGKTVIVATHWMDFIRRNCNRILVLNAGSIVEDGGIEKIDKYLKTYSSF
jgi:ABC-type polysaccharide/polyol phosphate transport system ATPase subunit